MIIPRKEDAKHKNQIYRLLKEILKDNLLANRLMFKGGTYAALRGALDRFSVDLDFDLPDKKDMPKLRKKCHQIFKKLGLEVKDESKKHLQFFLKYPAEKSERNTLKLEINDVPSPFNAYEKVFLNEIKMYCNGHTLETMFANKLVAAKARFDKHKKIAGRDIYDLHVFFSKGLNVNTQVVEEQTGQPYKKYLETLIKFIDKEVNKKILIQDLNPLLPNAGLNTLTDSLKDELLVFVKDEMKRLN